MPSEKCIALPRRCHTAASKARIADLPRDQRSLLGQTGHGKFCYSRGFASPGICLDRKFGIVACVYAT